MGDYDSEVMDHERIDPNNAGCASVIASGGQGAEPNFILSRAGCGFGGCVPRRLAVAGTMQGRMDARGGSRDKDPWRHQAVLGHGLRTADAVRDYAMETLTDDDALLIIDEPGS